MSKKPYAIVLVPARIKRKAGVRFASLEEVSQYLADRFEGEESVEANGLRSPHGLYRFEGFGWDDLPPLVRGGEVLYAPQASKGTFRAARAAV